MIKPPLNNYSFVFFRGLGRDAELWRDLLEVMQLPEERVFTWDLPGAGVFRKRLSPLSVSKLVDDIRSSHLNELPKKPAIIVGMSLGGMIAIDWITRFKNDFSAAALINTSVSSLSPPHRRLSLYALRQGLVSIVTRDTNEREKLILEMLSNNENNRVSALPKWTEIQEKRPVHARNVLRQLIAAAKFKLPKEKPRIPILVMNSLGDRLADPSCSKKLSLTWDLPLETHPTAGHDLPLDDPEWVENKIVHFLEKNPSSESP